MEPVKDEKLEAYRQARLKYYYEKVKPNGVRRQPTGK